MELVRVSRNVYGQEVLEGISWDLLPIFFGISAAFIVGHLIYKAVKK